MLVKASRSNHAGPTRPRAKRSFRLAVAALGAYGLLACTLVVGSQELTEGCPSGSKRCDTLDPDDDGVFESGCVSTDLPEYGCADPDPDCRPCSLTHASSKCGSDRTCIVAGCEFRYGDCTNDPGCETNVSAGDINNCSTCGYVCDDPWPNVAVKFCANFNCGIALCAEGRGNCNDVPSDGCETNTFSNEEHCGECDQPCATVCCGGACCAASEICNSVTDECEPP